MIVGVAARIYTTSLRFKIQRHSRTSQVLQTASSKGATSRSSTCSVACTNPLFDAPRHVNYHGPPQRLQPTNRLQSHAPGLRCAGTTEHGASATLWCKSQHVQSTFRSPYPLPQIYTRGSIFQQPEPAFPIEHNLSRSNVNMAPYGAGGADAPVFAAPGHSSTPFPSALSEQHDGNGIGGTPKQAQGLKPLALAKHIYQGPPKTLKRAITAVDESLNGDNNMLPAAPSNKRHTAGGQQNKRNPAVTHGRKAAEQNALLASFSKVKVDWR